MDYGKNYDKVIGSIRTEKGMAFDMEWVLVSAEGGSTHPDDEPNFCGTAGCVLGHTAFALFDRNKAWAILHNNDAMCDGVMGKLRMSEKAAKQLCYEDISCKEDKAVVIDILEMLKPIAIQREVTLNDVLLAETECTLRRNEEKHGV